MKSMWVVAAVLLAGCAEPAAPTDDAEPPVRRQVIVGYHLDAGSCASRSLIMSLEFDRLEPQLPPGYTAIDLGAVFSGGGELGRGGIMVASLRCSDAQNPEGQFDAAALGILVQPPSFPTPVSWASIHIFTLAFVTNTTSLFEAFQEDGWLDAVAPESDGPRVLRGDVSITSPVKDQPQALTTMEARNGSVIEYLVRASTPVPVPEVVALGVDDWSLRFWGHSVNGTGMLDVRWEGDVPRGAPVTCEFGPESVLARTLGIRDCTGSEEPIAEGVVASAAAPGQFVGGFDALEVQGAATFFDGQWAGGRT